MKRKWQLLLAAILVCLAGSIFLYVKEILPLFYGTGLACLTILLPLTSGLWVYKGRAARVFVILAGIAAFCAMVFLVDVTATRNTFKAGCEDKGPEYAFMVRGGDNPRYICVAPSELDYTESLQATSDISGVLYWPFLALLLGNVLHAPYLLWRLARRAFRKTKS